MLRARSRTTPHSGRRSLLVLSFLLLAASVAGAQETRFQVEPHPPFIQGIPFSVTVTATDDLGAVRPDFVGVATLDLLGDDGAAIGEPKPIEFRADDAGVIRVEGLLVEPAVGEDPADPSRTRRTRESYYKPVSVTVRVESTEARVARVLPDWTAVAPPAIAILLAVLFRQVIVALLLGVLVGVGIIHDFHPALTFTATIDDFVVPAVADKDHASIVVFSLLLGGMVGVISRSGGTAGIVLALAGRTSTRRSGQVSTAAIGSTIFFDDYANCLIVGNTMRPITDRLRISREKLAYLVDSTAAPVTSLIPLSTWVGAQIGYVQDGLAEAHLTGSAYSLIIQAIPYMFYPLFALALVFFIAFTGRDSFTMLYAERRAARDGKLTRDGAAPLAAAEEDEAIRAKPDKPMRAFNAFLPIITVVGVTIFGLIHTGWNGWEGATLDDGYVAAARGILGNANSYSALLWASFGGLLVAVVLAWIQRILSLDEAVLAAVAGMKAMLLAMIILVLAWSLAAATEQLHAIDYLHHVAVTLGIQGGWFPLLVFVLAAATAFATGTAWGTMSILVPIMVPLAHEMAGAPAEIANPILLGSIAACLGGAVFGDHCSPISDTTVLSSMSSSCDHIDHVRTQLPYALLGALFAGGAGYLPIAYGVSVWLSLPLGLVALFLVVRILFRPVERGEDVRPAAPDVPDPEAATT